MHGETISRALERDRMEHRIRRIERVIRALRDRAVYRHSVTGATPEPLRRTLSDLEEELDELRRRLSHLRSSGTTGPALAMASAGS